MQELISGEGQPKRLKGQRYTHAKVKSTVLQAEELRSKLDPEYPSFIKPLVRSHVAGGFWMGLHGPFCRIYLPQEDTFMTLESQNGKAYSVKYLPRRTGLSSGWKRFAVAERLLMGEVLVFHLVSTTKFKVYRIREKDSTEIDGAPFLLNSDTYATQSDRNTHMGGKEKNNKAHQVSSLAASAQHQDTRIIQPTENSENHNTEVTSRINTALQSPEGAILGSSSVASFENFNLMIDELLKDYELPRHIKWGYYKLCCTQNAVLHAQLLKETNHILVAGIIIEIVGIADALRKCKLSTFIDEFPIWEKTIDSFEHMGMNVGFLDAHLNPSSKNCL